MISINIKHELNDTEIANIVESLDYNSILKIMSLLDERKEFLETGRRNALYLADFANSNFVSKVQDNNNSIPIKDIRIISSIINFVTTYFSSISRITISIQYENTEYWVCYDGTVIEFDLTEYDPIPHITYVLECFIPIYYKDKMLFIDSDSIQCYDNKCQIAMRDLFKNNWHIDTETY